jgi:cbb3-type cytochrome oxidase maturation protein
MPISFWVYIGWMALVALIGIALFIWGWKHGQFKDIEGPKYTMLEDKEPEPWPDRKEGEK